MGRSQERKYRRVPGVVTESAESAESQAQCGFAGYASGASIPRRICGSSFPGGGNVQLPSETPVCQTGAARRLRSRSLARDEGR